MKRYVILAGLLLAALLAALGLWPSGSTTSAPSLATLARYPYVQNVSLSSITIVWHTDIPTEGWVEYGPSPSYGLAELDPELSARHQVTLGGLMPATTYYYRVVADGVPLTKGDTFRTAPPPGDAGEFSFVVLGDSGSGQAPQYAVASLIQYLAPGLILHTGDLIYPNSVASLYDAKFFAPYMNIIKSVPFYPSLGNHDVAADGGAAYLGVFVLPENSPSPERYYSFDYGNAHFVALDMYQPYGPGSAQYGWLVEDLAASDRFWKFVFFHPPPYSTGPHGSIWSIRQHLSPLFEAYNVDIVFSGHDHIYLRTTPRRDFVPESRAVTYVVTGGGGGPLYATGWADWVAVTKSTYHVVRITIQGSTLLLEAIEPGGTVIDSYAIDRSAEDSQARLLAVPPSLF